MCVEGAVLCLLSQLLDRVLWVTPVSNRNMLFRAWIVEAPYPPALFFNTCLHDPVPRLTSSHHEAALWTDHSGRSRMLGFSA